MRIEALSHTITTEIDKKVKSQKESEPSKTNKKDNVKISDAGKELANIESAKQKAIASDEVRMEKVLEVKQKVSDSFYDTPEFADQLAQKLTEEIDIDFE